MPALCAAGLTSPLQEAGTNQPCPACTKLFVVPGKTELDQLKAKQALEQRTKQQQQLEQQRAKEQADRERAKHQQLVNEENRELRAKEAAEEDARRRYNDTHCPYCFEEIRSRVKKCKHCHEYLDWDLRDQAAKRQIVRISMKRRDWWIGIAILVALGLAAWLFPRPTKIVIDPPMSEMERAGKREEALADAAAGQVGIFKSGINLYKFHTRSHPSNRQALIVAPADVATGWDGPYLDGDVVPLDPWNQEFKFAVPAKRSTKDAFDVWSIGPDGKDGTSDDIGNW